MNIMYSRMAMAFMGALCLVGCNESDDYATEQPTVQNKVDESKLADVLANLVDNNDEKFADGGYIVYSAADRSVITLSYDEYALGSLISGDTEQMQPITEVTGKDLRKKIPAHDGWVFAGKCKTRIGALKLAAKISSEIGANENFEIHVERNSDGSSSVWYRII